VTTAGFFTALLIGGFTEAFLLCIAVPIMMWAWSSTALRRAQTRQLNRSNEAADAASQLLDDIYAEIRAGTVVAPKEIENRILDVKVKDQETGRSIR
jgi:hypothetical protein